MEDNPRRVCELIVGLGDVEVLGVEGEPGWPLAVHVRSRRRPVCWGCGGEVRSKGQAAVSLVDLPAFGRPARLVQRERRWRCPAADCSVGSFTEADERIAPPRPTAQPRVVHLHRRRGWRPAPRRCPWSGRRGADRVDRGAARGVALQHRLGGAGALRRLPQRLRRGAARRRTGRGPFHVVRPADDGIDETRRRVQNDTLGHRGRKGDPLYRIRRLLLAACERLGEAADAKIRGLLAVGDPRGDVRLAWHAKETLRGLYDIDDPRVAAEYLTELAADLQDPDCPAELRRPIRTLARWYTQILNWHRARVSNGPTEAINNLTGRVKRVAFGFRRFAHYRIRALLYAGRPNWALLATVRPR